jgi:predicted PurR-regulated permease PerM
MSSEPRGIGTAIGQGRRLARTVNPATVLAVLAVLVVLHAISWILLPFVLSGVVAYVCTPLIDGLARLWRLPRTVIAGAIFAILVAAAAGIAALGISPLTGQLAVMVTDFRGTIEDFVRVLFGDKTLNIFGEPMNAAAIAEAITVNARAWINEHPITLISVSVAGLFGVLLTVVLLFYFLISGPSLGRGIFWLVPPDSRPFAQRVWSRLDPVLKRYFIGVVIVVTYAALAAYIGLGLVLGIKHAVFLALLTSLLEMIPVIGPAAAIIIAGLVAVQQATSFWAIIGYAIYATVLRLSIDQLIGPIVLGQAARLHPTVIIFCFLSGGLLFGIAGIILAVPVALTIRVILNAIYEDALLSTPANPPGT